MHSGSTGIQLSFSTYQLADIPVAKRPENSVKANNRKGFSIQSNGLYVSVDKNLVGPLALPCIHSKLINCRIVTRLPSL